MNYLIIITLIFLSGCITTENEMSEGSKEFLGQKAIIPSEKDSVQEEYYFDGKLKSKIYSSHGQITHILYFDEDDGHLFRQTDYLNGIPVATVTFDDKGNIDSKTSY